MRKQQSSIKLEGDLYIFYLLMLAVLAAIIYFATLPFRNLGFNNEDCILLEQDWIYENTDGKAEKVKLPFSLKANMEEGIRVSRILPTDHEDHANMVALWVTMQYVTAYLDGEPIYSFRPESRPLPVMGKAEGSGWHVIRLPDGWEGKKLTLELTSPYPDYIGKTKSIYLGTKASFMFQVFKVYGMEFLFSILIMGSGIFFLIANLVMYRSFYGSRSLAYISWFQIWMGIWMFTECGLMQFVSKNLQLMHILSFLSIMVFPIPLILYIKGIRNIHATKLLQLIVVLHILNIAGTTVLQLLGIADYYETLFISHILLLLTMLVLVVVILWERLKYHNEEMQYLFSSGLVLAAAGIAELVLFYKGERLHTGEIFSLGVLYFMVMMSYKVLRQIHKAVIRGNEARYYEKLATVDFMTLCQNKTAYLKFMDDKEAFLQKNHSIFIVMADLNHLKHINDNFGHHMGDGAIRLCAKILLEQFGDHGVCYRIGGDEFLCICSNCEEGFIQERIKKVGEICDRESLECGYTFQVAIGYARYNTVQDMGLDETVKRADEAMYIQKRKMKDN